MLTFQQAREAVALHIVPRWPGLEAGRPFVADWGSQDETHWEVIAGAKEYLVDGDQSFVMMDLPVFLVDKRTGDVEEVPFLEALGRLERMEPVGSPPEHLG